MALSDELLKLINIADDIGVIRNAVLNEIPGKLQEMESRMAAREDAAYQQLNTTIQTVKDGWASLVAERDQYKAALEQADAARAAAVAAALEEDSNVDASKVEAADAALAELVAQPAPAEPAEPTPNPDEGAESDPSDPNS